MLLMSIIIPLVGAFYLIWQIHQRDLRSWQHYACLVALIFLVSILFLVASGKVESFDVAGNNVRIVDQKLEQVKQLTEQNELMAKKTVEMVEHVTSHMIADASYDIKGAHQSEVDLLKAAGLSDADIKRFFDELDQGGSKTNSP